MGVPARSWSRALRSTLLAAALLLACDAKSSSTGPLSNDGGDSVDGSFAGTDAQPPAVLADGACPTSLGNEPPAVHGGGCPQSPPEAGSPCTPGPDDCEYGDPRCPVGAGCGASTGTGPFAWLSGGGQCCNEPQCPAWGAVANGATCPVDATCTYAEGRCGCVPCAPGDGGLAQGETEWECATWMTPAGCPEPRPLIGTVCTNEGQECDYGPLCCAQVETEPAIVCTSGLWRRAGGGCDCAEPTCGQ
jgi:hypothetical protein